MVDTKKRRRSSQSSLSQSLPSSIGDNNEMTLRSFSASDRCLMHSEHIWDKVIAKTYENGEKFRIVQNGDLIIRPGGKLSEEGGKLNHDYCKNGCDFVGFLRRVDYPLYVSLLEAYLQGEDDFVLKLEHIWDELQPLGWKKFKRLCSPSDDWQGIGDDVYLPPGEMYFPDPDRIYLAKDEVAAWTRLHDKKLFSKLLEKSKPAMKLSHVKVRQSPMVLAEEEIVRDCESVQSSTPIKSAINETNIDDFLPKSSASDFIEKTLLDNSIDDDIPTKHFLNHTTISSLRFSSVWKILQEQGWKKEDKYYFAPGISFPIENVVCFLDSKQENFSDEVRLGLRENFLRQYYHYDEVNAFICGTLISSLEFLRVWTFLNAKYDWSYSAANKYLPPQDIAHYVNVGEDGLNNIRLVSFLDGSNDIIIKNDDFIHSYRRKLRENLLQDYYEKFVMKEKRKSNKVSAESMQENGKVEFLRPEKLCEICFNYERDTESNELVKLIECRVCSLSIHADCYGIEPNEEDDCNFICDVCQMTRKSKKQNKQSQKRSYSGSARGIELRCVLCLRQDVAGGLKLTSDQKKWSHVFCALNSLEVYFDQNGINGYKEALETMIDKQNSGSRSSCDVCLKQEGYLTKCTRKSCQKHIHPLCAESKKYECNETWYKLSRGADYCQVRRYKCADHSMNRLSCEICGEGKKVQTFVSCNGKCGNLFHPACVGLDHLPFGPWYCSICIDSCHDDNAKECSQSKIRKRVTDIENGADAYFKIINNRKARKNIAKEQDVDDGEKLINVSSYSIFPKPSEVVKNLPLWRGKHQREINLLKAKYSTYYEKWSFMLKIGYSICLLGFGSKTSIIESFVHKSLKYEGDVVSIEGFNRDFEISDFLDILITNLLGENTKIDNNWDFMNHAGSFDEFSSLRSSISDASKLTKRAACFACQVSHTLQRPLFIAIKNIDGPSLLNHESQSVLSALVAFSNRMIRLIASCDNVNIFDAWESATMARYNWTFADVTTFDRYGAEIMALEQLPKKTTSISKSEKNVKGVSDVLYSLAQKHSDILRELASIISKTRNVGGVIYKDFLKHCRNKMLIDTDRKMREIMGELLDHSMMFIRKHSRGEEYLEMPLEVVDEILSSK